MGSDLPHGAEHAAAEPIAIAVVQFEDCFLIGQRAKEAPLGGLYEFPGGKMEPGESPEQAAVRECQEETGLAVQAVHPLLETIETYDHAVVHLHFILCQLFDDHQAEPRSPFFWARCADVASYPFPKGNQEILKRIQEEGLPLTEEEDSIPPLPAKDFSKH